MSNTRIHNKHLLLLINPRSRRGAQMFEQVARQFRDSGYTIVNDHLEFRSWDFNALIRRFRNQTDVVVVGGGDGSINCCLEALVETGLPLHIVPLGTANNLARSLQIPAHVSENIELLKSAFETKIDLGTVNGNYFVNVAGVGLSTRINRMVTKRSKSLFGPLAFFFTALAAIPKLKPFTIMLKYPGGIHIAKSWQVTICNGRHFGSGITVEETASLNDGTFDLLSLEMERWWQGFFIAPALFMGRTSGKETVTTLKADRFELYTRRPKKVDVDGDLKTQTPAIFEIKRKALKVLVSREVALSLGEREPSGQPRPDGPVSPISYIM